MNHTAADLFPGWYNKGINKEASSEELEVRKKAIDLILKESDRSFWIQLLRVYLGIDHFGSDGYTQILNAVKVGDENFPIQNENLVRLISGCAVEFKIDENQSFISDLLAVSLLSSKILKIKSPLIEEFNERALHFWVRESESKRDLNLDFKIGGGSLKSNTKINIPQITADQTTFAGHSNSVVDVITSLQKDLNKTNSESNSFQKVLGVVKKNLIALSEETNILWWLFGAYSTSLKKPFNELSTELLSIIIAVEISQLTASLPGIGTIDSIIQRALANTHVGDNKLPIHKIVSSIKGHYEKLKSSLPTEIQELVFCTPILNALKCYVDFPSSQWKTVFKNQAHISLNTKIDYQDLTIQLYTELMLIRIFESLD